MLEGRRTIVGMADLGMRTQASGIVTAIIDVSMAAGMIVISVIGEDVHDTRGVVARDAAAMPQLRVAIRGAAPAQTRRAIH